MIKVTMDLHTWQTLMDILIGQHNFEMLDGESCTLFNSKLEAELTAELEEDQ